MKEVKQAPTITPPKDMTNLECIDEGLKGLSDYFNAALEGGESKAALRRMWDQQMGILAVLLKNHQNEPALSGVKNALAEYQAYEKGFSDGKKEHDATLLAQEREKWERERPAWKLLESVPDKNNIVVFGAKEDPEGHFVSREKAIEFMLIKDAECKHKIAQVREDVLKQIDKVLSEKYDKSDLYDCGYRGGLSQVKEWLK